MMIARGRKAIKPFPAGLWTTKRSEAATLLHIILDWLPNFSLIIAGSRAERKSRRAFSRGTPLRHARESSCNRPAALLIDDLLPTVPEARMRTVTGSQTR